jgi:hypothetical protein
VDRAPGAQLTPYVRPRALPIQSHAIGTNCDGSGVEQAKRNGQSAQVGYDESVQRTWRLVRGQPATAASPSCCNHQTTPEAGSLRRKGLPRNDTASRNAKQRSHNAASTQHKETMSKVSETACSSKHAQSHSVTEVLNQSKHSPDRSVGFRKRPRHAEQRQTANLHHQPSKLSSRAVGESCSTEQHTGHAMSCNLHTERRKTDKGVM